MYSKAAVKQPLSAWGSGDTAGGLSVIPMYSKAAVKQQYSSAKYRRADAAEWIYEMRLLLKHVLVVKLQ
jgi:hypothetical protein